MPTLNDIPGEIKRKKFIKALKRLGFVINKKGGNGSHYKIRWPQTEKSITIPQKLNKNVIYYIVKEIENCSGLNWDNIKDEL